MREHIQALAHKVGLEIGRFPPRYRLRRTGELLMRLGIDVVVDIGANGGQYACGLRDIGGYRRRIVSLEPASAAFARLQAACQDDPAWDCRRLAVMDRDGEMTLQIAVSDDLNSFNLSSGLGRAALPAIAARAQETVPTARLDSIYEELVGDSTAFLKIDVQGSESFVLTGAQRSLKRIVGLQLELPLVPIYERQASASELISRLEEAGLGMVGVEPLFFDSQIGLNVEFDALFLQHKVVESLAANRMRGASSEVIVDARRHSVTARAHRAVTITLAKLLARPTQRP